VKLSVLAVALLSGAASAYAQPYPTVKNSNVTTAASAYWTPDRLARAVPRSLPVATGLFCPAYKVGVNPALGCWSWINASTTEGWFTNGYFSRDYAVVITAPTGTVLAENVVSAVGGLGFAWNWGRDQHWFHFGYPAKGPCTDGLMCVTSTEHRYDVSIDPGPAVNSRGSDQTSGASGSPVVLFFSGNGGGINSDVSFYFNSGPNGDELGHELQGPYYDTNTCNFWKTWTGYSGSC
jgi:hypothetical protein